MRLIERSLRWKRGAEMSYCSFDEVCFVHDERRVNQVHSCFFYASTHLCPFVPDKFDDEKAEYQVGNFGGEICRFCTPVGEERMRHVGWNRTISLYLLALRYTPASTRLLQRFDSLRERPNTTS